MSEEKRPRVLLINRCFVISEQGLLLAVRRSDTDNHNPGMWEVPGGKLDEGQDLDGALEREVMEETGFLVRLIDSLAHYDSRILGDNSSYRGSSYVVLFGISNITGGELKLSHEHTEAMWCTYQTFLDLDLTYETKKAAIVLKKRLMVNGVS